MDWNTFLYWKYKGADLGDGSNQCNSVIAQKCGFAHRPPDTILKTDTENQKLLLAGLKWGRGLVKKTLFRMDFFNFYPNFLFSLFLVPSFLVSSNVETLQCRNHQKGKLFLDAWWKYHVTAFNVWEKQC